MFQDADLEYDPNDYAKLIEPVLRFDADVVMGSRLSAPQFTRVYYFWHKIGNRFITLIFNILMIFFVRISGDILLLYNNFFP